MTNVNKPTTKVTIGGVDVNKPMIDEWKQELHALFYEYATNWEDWECLEDIVIEKIDSLITQATSKAREEERTKFIHLLKTTPYGFPNADMSPSTFIENVIKSLKKDK